MATDLETPQLRAIKKAAALGKILQKDLPEIAKDYENGLSKPKIVEKYNLEEVYKVGNNVAKNAVAIALRGHSGYLGVEAYSGLIKPSELERLASEHQAIAFNSMTKKQRIASGKRVFKQKLGIHGYTPSQRKKMGAIGGRKARDNKLGFHALSNEQKIENRKKAMIASGLTAYLPGEKERICELADDPDYQSKRKGPSYKTIAVQINKEFHEGNPIRTASSVNYVLFRG